MPLAAASRREKSGDSGEALPFFLYDEAPGIFPGDFLVFFTDRGEGRIDKDDVFEKTAG